MSALSPVEFAINIKQNILHANAASVTADFFQLSLFTGEVKPILVTLVTGDQAGGLYGSLRTIPNAGIALTLALIKADKSALLGGPTLMTATGPNQFEGDLILNTSDFTTLNPPDPYPAWLEGNIESGSEILKILVPVRIYKAILDVDLQPVPPPDTALGSAEADQRYVRKRGDYQFIMKDTLDDSEHIVRIYGGQLQVSPLT